MRVGVMSTTGRARTGRVVRQRLQEGLLLLSGADRDRLLLLMEVMRKKLMRVMGVMVLTARGGGVRRQGRTGGGGGVVVVVVHVLVRRLGRLTVSSVKSAAAVFARPRQRRTGRTGTGHAALGHRRPEEEVVMGVMR